ncbi:unnamed protein product [Thelazia callipaeda]|uniref:E3 ubiquitin-protein ligase RBBP6 n=1 Tax=Thelazia callipaeda TaxID=103827 RepID=A0A0N5CZD9_THECL|nr:unnamed protein product [Thelazia callipaeda]
MSSIHYKFKATLEYKTLVFDGLHISVMDLKKEICEKENIKAESFDLILTNAHTKRQYTGDELIPRNSSVIVQRTPRDNAVKLPKVQDTTNSGIVVSHVPVETPVVGHIDSEEFDKMTEEERMAHVKEVSAYKFLPSNFQKKTSSIMSGPPPPTYVCNRCSQSGHWYKNCPMVTLNTRRTTGITMNELMETTSDDPLAMLHPSGKYVVPIMHWKARQKKPEVAKPEPEIREVPPELKCPICSQLLREAVLTTCCGDSFCADCFQHRLLETPNAKCPGTNCFQTAVSADKLVPNLKMRQAVEAFKNSAVHSASSENITCTEDQPTHTVSRVRIGLSGRPQQVQSSLAIHQPQQQQEVTQVQSSAPTYIVASSTSSIVSTVAQPQIAAKQFPTSVSTMPPVIPKLTTTTVETPNVQQLNITPLSLHLPVNVHQPPPGYPAILAPAQPLNAIASSSTESLMPGTHRNMNVIHMSAPPPLLPPGVQPPPPGLSSMLYPRVAAHPIKDAWDEYLERKDKESRQRAVAPRRRRRSTRSTSYSSESSTSESSSESSSRSRSRSFSRDRSHRDKRRSSVRDKHSSRRRDSRSPFRNSYASIRYHRDTAAQPFNFYQHPPSGASALGLPGSSLIHHRIPSLLNNFTPQYTSIQTNQTAAYTSFSATGSVPNYRSSRTYQEERGRRRTPRTTAQNRRKTDSKEEDGERKERIEERKRAKDNDEKVHREDRERKTKCDSDREERRQKREKYRRRQEKECKSEGVESENVAKKEEKYVNEEAGLIEKTATTGAEHLESGNFDEVVGGDNMEKENETVDEALPDQMMVESATSGGFHTKQDDGSEAEAENENENENGGVEEKTELLIENNGNVVVEGEEITESKEERNERRKHKKKRRKHRRHGDNDEQDGDSAGGSHRKHKRHKRSKEEKEERKREKERRREERRRRRQEREAARMNLMEAKLDIEHNEIAHEIRNEIEDDGDIPPSDANEAKKDKVIVKPAIVEVLEQKSVDKTPRDKKSKEATESGNKNENKNDAKSADIHVSAAKTDERKDGERHRHGKSRKRKHDSHRRRDDSYKEDCRGSKTRKDERDSRKSDEHQDSRKENIKSRKSDKTSEKRDRKGKSRGVEKESKRSEPTEKNKTDCSKEMRRKERGEKRANDVDRVGGDNKRSRTHSNDSRDEQRDSPIKIDHKPAADTSVVFKKDSEVEQVSSAIQNETDSLLLARKTSSVNVRLSSKIVESDEQTVVHKKLDQKRFDEVKVSLQKESERKADLSSVPIAAMPNLTVEVKSGNEKRVTRETIFEGATPNFNARQKIKMVLLSDSERKAADRLSKKKFGLK